MAFSLRHFSKAAPRRSLRASTAFVSLNAMCGGRLAARLASGKLLATLSL